jgi:L-alanine-DL-glutamate epimerase-like enolase superfamily enzyme
MDSALRFPVRALKLAIDPFWRDEPQRAAELLCAARSHVGNELELMLDATASFNDCQQIEPLLPALRECRIKWLEAPFPLDNLDQFRELQKAGIPVGAGDTGLTAPAEWLPFFREGQIDIAQPDISWVGGFTALKQIAEMATQHSCRLIPHGWNTDLTLAANLHFLAVQPKAEYAEFSTSTSPLRWQLSENGPQIDRDGMIAVPQGAGLGIDLNDETVQRYRVG